CCCAACPGQRCLFDVDPGRIVAPLTYGSMAAQYRRMRARRRLNAARIGLHPAGIEPRGRKLLPTLRVDAVRLGARLFGLAERISSEKVAGTVGKRQEQAERTMLGQWHHDQAAISE